MEHPDKRFCYQLPDGGIGIYHSVRLSDAHQAPGTFDDQDAEDFEAYSIEKNAFELYRYHLPNAALDGKALHQWQALQHFNDYTGQVPMVCREIMLSDLPPSREFRNRWQDDGSKITVKPEV